jgi:hypothetical protein
VRDSQTALGVAECEEASLEEGEAVETLGRRPLLGGLLIEQGVLGQQEVEWALAEQVKSGRKLGEILIERDLLSRPFLARVLARQAGVALEDEGGFGSGLRALIERRHLERSGLSADQHLSASLRPLTDRRSLERRASADRRKTADRRRTESSW